MDICLFTNQMIAHHFISYWTKIEFFGLCEEIMAALLNVRIYLRSVLFRLIFFLPRYTYWNETCSPLFNVISTHLVILLVVIVIEHVLILKIYIYLHVISVPRSSDPYLQVLWFTLSVYFYIFPETLIQF